MEEHEDANNCGEGVEERENKKYPSKEFFKLYSKGINNILKLRLDNIGISNFAIIKAKSFNHDYDTVELLVKEVIS